MPTLLNKVYSVDLIILILKVQEFEWLISSQWFYAYLDSFFMMKNANKKMAIAKGGREVNEKMGEGNF